MRTVHMRLRPQKHDPTPARTMCGRPIVDDWWRPALDFVEYSQLDCYEVTCGSCLRSILAHEAKEPAR